MRRCSQAGRRRGRRRDRDHRRRRRRASDARRPIRQQGFVHGAPRASAHGTAVASLIAGQAGARRRSRRATVRRRRIRRDPAGGNALALARALGWLAAQRVRVVTVSLVGPTNPLVARAVAQARARGMWIVAAVGNDGRAAPPAFPASYPGVIAVTGVDGRGRVLIEAGRALHLDYAAPGADMAAAGLRGAVVAVRGTSYAVPLVAGRLARHVRAANVLAGLDAEAVRGACAASAGALFAATAGRRFPTHHRAEPGRGIKSAAGDVSPWRARKERGSQCTGDSDEPHL